MNSIRRCNICCRLHKTGITANSGETVAVDGITKPVDVNLYSLQPYHREINLIELVRNEIKRRAAVNNTQFGASFMDSLIGDTFGAMHTAST